MVKPWNCNENRKMENRNRNCDPDQKLHTNNRSLQLFLEIQRKIVKQVDVGAAYEFQYFNDTKYSDFQPRHLKYIFINGKSQLGRATIQCKERIQVTKKDVSDRIKDNGEIDTYAINPGWYWRNRIKIVCKIRKLPVSPSFSFESFYQLNNLEKNVFDKLRYNLSLDYHVAKHHLFGLDAIIDQKINTKKSETRFITSWSYIYIL